MKLRSLVLVLVSTAVFAAKPSSNIPVTTYLSDTNANTGAAYYIQSDGMIGPVHGVLGEYDNGYQSVGSYLNANTYNQEPPGDWTLDLLSSSVRTMKLSLTAAVPAGEPGYTVPPNPPFAGSRPVVSRFAEFCTAVYQDIGTMNQVGQTLTCPAIFRFNLNGAVYRLFMTGSWGTDAPESTWVQIQCNSVSQSDGYCNDWSIDSLTPSANPDGTTDPGSIGRLTTPGTRNGSVVNLGDFYVTFHVHVTRP
jgi:hypothetical protein